MNYAITTAGRLGRVDDAIKIFENVANLGYSPEIMTYNNIIWATGHCGREELATQYYKQLLQQPQYGPKSFKPNVYSFSALMHAYAKSQNYRKALSYLEELLSQGHKLNLVVFAAAMDACASAGKHREASWVLERVEEQGLSPDATMMNTAVKAFIAAGEMTTDVANLVEYVCSENESWF